MNKISKSDIAVVVFSSDGYSDFWDIFFSFFFSYSGLEFFDVYLITETKSFHDDRVRVLNVPNAAGKDWSTRVIGALHQIPNHYVIAFTEDLLCTSPCSHDDLVILKNFVLASDSTYIRLAPMPPPNRGLRRSFIPLGVPSLHRVSLQPSLWNRKRLIDLLEPGESPWEFELKGTIRSYLDNRFYCANYFFLHYQEVIGRGRITRRGFRLLKKHGLTSTVKRQKFTIYEELARNFSHLKSKFFYVLPSPIKLFLINWNFVGEKFTDQKNNK